MEVQRADAKKCPIRLHDDVTVIPPAMSARKRKPVPSPPLLKSGCFSSNWLALQPKLSESTLHEKVRGKKVVVGGKKKGSDKGEPARKKSKGNDQQA